MNNLSVWLLASFYILAGSFHFIHPDVYLPLMPPYLPSHLTLIYISGFCEMFFGILILFKAIRLITSWLIIALLIAIFPANVHLAMVYTQTQHPYYWFALLRLPLQLALIWWAWKVGRAENNHTL